MKGFVFNIQRFSIYDGPGIRTTVFLKGCNLRCQWCHNPESMNVHQELQYFEQLCTKCNRCVEACQNDAITLDKDGIKVFDRHKCIMCGACENICMYDALKLTGKQMEVDDVFKIVMKDYEFYKNSKGGLTISGGEPLLQKDFVLELFKRTKEVGIHNVLDTAANVEWSVIEKLLPYLDTVLLDIKVMNHEEHLNRTGVYNHRILENAIKLAEEEVDIIVRIPVIPLVNASEDNMIKTARFLQDFKRLIKVELLPYHTLGIDKNISLGEKIKIKTFNEPEIEEVEKYTRIFKNHGIEAQVG